MDLFGTDSSRNLLPVDGVVNYHGRVFGHDAAANYREALLAEVPWKSDEIVIFGKRIVTSRKVAWYGDEGLAYAYSGTVKQPFPWSPVLSELKARVEDLAGAGFNSCLLNLYHHGDEGMGWHADNEKSIVRDSAIASVSFGAEREFRLKHRVFPQKVSVVLEDGSLLVMKGTTQTHWLHSIPKSKKIQTPRINLTFRNMVTGG